MRTHASAQHFGAPQRGSAFERDDLLKAKSRRTAQDGAHVACVLYTVQYDAGYLGVNYPCYRQIKHKTHAGG